MPIRLFLCCLFAFPVTAAADAGKGQFMGYELGTTYPTTPKKVKATTTGNLLIVAENPTKPNDITQVSLITTPQSQTIGHILASSWHETEAKAREAGRHYAELLRTKYPDWAFGRERLDANFRVVEVYLDKAPYSIQLRLMPDEHDGRTIWRFSMALSWQNSSSELRAWNNRAAIEHAAAKTEEREKQMKNSDTRGL